ncbi:hypothetical protein Q9966_009464 [Columba livia]|nr:hypothetical protein Q9966_009464 [Columba livia]
MEIQLWYGPASLIVPSEGIWQGIWDPCEIIWCLHRELKQYVIVFLSSALVQVHQGPELSWYLSGERKIADELCLFIRNIPVIIGVWFDKSLIGDSVLEACGGSYHLPEDIGTRYQTRSIWTESIR